MQATVTDVRGSFSENTVKSHTADGPFCHFRYCWNGEHDYNLLEALFAHPSGALRGMDSACLGERMIYLSCHSKSL